MTIMMMMATMMATMMAQVIVRSQKPKPNHVRRATCLGKSFGSRTTFFFRVGGGASVAPQTQGTQDRGQGPRTTAQGPRQNRHWSDGGCTDAKPRDAKEPVYKDHQSHRRYTQTKTRPSTRDWVYSMLHLSMLYDSMRIITIYICTIQFISIARVLQNNIRMCAICTLVHICTILVYVL